LRGPFPPPSLRRAGIEPRQIVFEDEVTPDVVRKVYDHFRQATGQEPTMLFPGAGGYWWRLVHRDTVAAAFKRTATGEHPNVKFSNSPGKESIGGYLRGVVGPPRSSPSIMLSTKLSRDIRAMEMATIFARNRVAGPLRYRHKDLDEALDAGVVNVVWLHSSARGPRYAAMRSRFSISPSMVQLGSHKLSAARATW